MSSWTDDKKEKHPCPKKLKLSLDKADKHRRYQFLDEEMQPLAIKFVPQNIATSTKWELTNWKSCRKERFTHDIYIQECPQESFE